MNLHMDECNIVLAMTSKVKYTVDNMVVDAPLVSPEEAFKKVADGAILVDASRSQDYRNGHARESVWITRSRVTKLDCRLSDTIIVTGQEKSLILGVVSDFLELGFTNMFWFSNPNSQNQKSESPVQTEPRPQKTGLK